MIRNYQRRWRDLQTPEQVETTLAYRALAIAAGILFLACIAAVMASVQHEMARHGAEIDWPAGWRWATR